MIIRLWNKGKLIAHYEKADRLTRYDNELLQIDYLNYSNKQCRASYYPKEFDTIEVKEK